MVNKEEQLKDKNTLIGKRLKLLKLAKRLKTKDIANILGVSAQQFIKYEAGRNRISAASLCVLAESLGQPISFFCSEGYLRGIDREAKTQKIN